MRTLILAAAALGALAAPAAAEVRADDLARFYLSECGGDGAYKPFVRTGPVTPRVAAPADAAPWLEDRAWDVRPYKPCPVARKAVRAAPKAKAAPVQRRAAPRAMPIK